jgi:AraC-like DNA-binding protein
VPSRLLLPPSDLSSCIFAAVVRDTRGLDLSEMDRFNHFPASPLVGITKVFTGETRMVSASGGLAEAMIATALPSLTVSGPQDLPIISWNPTSVYAISVGFFPEAWTVLFGQSPTELLNLTHEYIPDSIAKITNETLFGSNVEAEWDVFCAALSREWTAKRLSQASVLKLGAARLHDWAQSIAIKALLSGPGGSIRTAERRLRRWTGNSKSVLQFHAQIENLYALSVKKPNTSLAELALDAGYTDQSHMGRAVHRLSGFSPAQLNRLIRSDEPFWLYRLMAERF